MARIGRLFPAVLIGVQFLACGKSGDHLYHYVRPDPKSVASESKVLQIVAPSQLDIVWVIDNSGSMKTYQDAVIANAERFMQEFSKIPLLKWQMGVISTDDRDAYAIEKEYGFTAGSALTHQTRDNTQRFKDAVDRLGIGGNATEKTFTPLQMLIEERHPRFVSSKGFLVFIVLTDAREQSKLSAGEFIKWLETVKGGSLKKVRTYGILSATDLGCKPGAGEEAYTYRGSPYEQLISATQGEVFKICDPDFGKNLAEIGRKIADLGSISRVLLAGRPRPSTIELFFKGQLLPRGSKEAGGIWTYDVEHNSIEFHNMKFLANESGEAMVEIHFDEDDGHGKDL